ncbi:MAG: hypothetical protein JXR48_05185 [Candidatus Delongbacteria bacterium]|nr:hypothetical protein [Candidatus Delongbacteria bacterium]MBN2834342.1 hypothetical protein [Candidatus Delongbacteria bacterium]
MRFLVLVSIAILMIACSKKSSENFTIENGVKIFSNTNEVKDPNLKYTLTEAFEINNDEAGEDSTRVIKSVSDLVVDRFGNLFLFDSNSFLIKKYDTKGNFLMSFGKQGQGPGEYTFGFDFFLVGDTLSVQDIQTASTVRFNIDGSFIDKRPYIGVSGLVIGESINGVKNDKVIGYKPTIKREKEDMYIGNDLVLMDVRFNEICKLREYITKIDPDDIRFFDSITKYTIAKDKIYMSENSEDRYSVYSYDFNGKQLETIRKTYMKISYNDEEQSVMDKNLQLGINGKQLHQTKTYKKSINSLYVDKYGRLLVCASKERKVDDSRKFYADVFQDGVLLNSIEIPELSTMDFMSPLGGIIVWFIGDRIYQWDDDKSTLKVFDYI